MVLVGSETEELAVLAGWASEAARCLDSVSHAVVCPIRSDNPGRVAGRCARGQVLSDEHLALAVAKRSKRPIYVVLSVRLCAYRSKRTTAGRRAATFAEGLAKATETDNRPRIALSDALGKSLFLLGEYSRAELVLQAALDAFVRVGFRFGSIEALVTLGYITLEKRAVDRARGIFDLATNSRSPSVSDQNCRTA